jgi:CRP/FNR family transcriptional regulator, cyclic AMP receptor protein
VAKDLSPEVRRVRLVLGRSPHFRALGIDTLDRLARLARIVRYRDGQLVVPAWKLPAELGVVLSGGLRTTFVSEDGADFVAGMLGEGSFYGANALLGEVQTPAEGHAAGDTEVALFDVRRLRALAAGDRKLGAHFSQLVYTRYMAVLSLLRDAVTAPLARRVARRLLGHALSSGRSVPDAAIELRMSQTDLAAMLGASRTKVNAELRLLEKAGALSLGYRQIVVRDMERLRKLAGPGVMPL